MDTKLYGLLHRQILGVASGVQSVSVIGYTIHFVFTDGLTAQMTFPAPKDGVGIVSLEIDAANHLIAHLSDNTTLDAGVMPSGTLKESLTVSNPIGSASMGKVYPAGTSTEEILRDMLIREVPPAVSLTLNPSDSLYDAVNGSLSEITLTASVTKNTYDIASVDFYVGATLIKSTTTNVANGGSFSATHTFTPAVNTDQTFKVVVTDIKGLNSSATKSVKFIGKVYYGILSAEVGIPTDNQIRSLANRQLQATRNLVYSGITTPYGKVCYAYPTSLGSLTSIKDEVNNLNYFTSFSKNEIQVDGIPYFVYTQIDPSSADNVELTFK